MVLIKTLEQQFDMIPAQLGNMYLSTYVACTTACSNGVILPDARRLLIITLRGRS